MATRKIENPPRWYSVEEYLAFEESSPMRHEYVGGALYAFAGASARHNKIALRIASRLLASAGDGPCEVFMSDVKLRAAEDAYYYPDIMVTCDPEDDDPYIKHRPNVIVEVLSPTTASDDLRDKLLSYRRIDSLNAYVIVYQDERRVIIHSRRADGSWWTNEIAGTGTVSFPGPTLDLSLDDIYRGITD